MERKGKKRVRRKTVIQKHRRLKEGPLKKLEEKLSKFLRVSSEVLIMTRFKTGEIFDVSESIVNLTGYTRDETIGTKSVDLYVNIEDRKMLLNELIKKGRCENFETLFKTRLGGVKKVSINAELLKINGEPFIVGSVRDITPFKIAEEELRNVLIEISFINRVLTHCTGSLKLNELLKNVLNEILEFTQFEGGGICLLEEDNILSLFAFEGFSEERVKDLTEKRIKVGEGLCGKSALDGKPFILTNPKEVFSFTTRESLKKEEINYHTSFPLISKEKCQGVLCLFTRKDKKLDERRQNLISNVCSNVALAIENSLLYKKTFEFSEALEKTVNERTKELEEANRKLKELDRLKSLFIASMSHELRTPLNSIIGFTGILLQKLVGELNEEQIKQLTIVQNSARHLLALINDIIDISKIEAGEARILIEEFGLSELAREVLDSFRVDLERKNLEVREKIEEGIKIKSDRRRIKQILNNFISNAIKFTEKGSIEVNLLRKAEKVEISVKDTGAGIMEEDLEKIFDPFSKIFIKGRPNVEGTGLGLYICRKIATLLGGNINVRSEFGKGSSFTLTLPIN